MLFVRPPLTSSCADVWHLCLPVSGEVAARGSWIPRVWGGWMRILIYSTNFAPEPTGIGKYSGDMACWLADHGHEVRVVCAPPYYPAWQLDGKYRWPLYRREKWRGVDVWRTPLWVPKSPKGGLTRVVHLLSFAITSFT